jgi:ribokinase
LVVSVGSANVDRTVEVDEGTLAELSERFDWFPAPGETVLLDEIPDLPEFEWRVSLGGKGANQAVAAARAGADAALVGAVGRDQDEVGVLESLSTRGVDVSGVDVVDAPTGKAYIFLAPDGENHIAVVPGANATVGPDDIDEHWDAIQGADALLVQHELPTETVGALLDRLDGLAEGRRPTVVLDPAPAEGVEPLLAHDSVDVVTPNETEYAALRDALDGFDGTGVRTRGPDPVTVSNADEFTVAPPAVEPVDATGAGDAFAGYLAAALADGDSLREAVETATVAASLSTTAAGAQDAVPTMAEVRAFRDG